MSRILVVANQTVASSELVQAIKDRSSKGPAEFTLLVPATAHAHRTTAEVMGHIGTQLPAAPDAVGATTAEDYEAARRRMEFGVEQLRELGVTVDGDVGDPNPLKAVDEALSRRSYDEIILSTLPSGISRWLNQDLPAKVKRRSHLPVTTVTASRPRR